MALQAGGALDGVDTRWRLLLGAAGEARCGARPWSRVREAPVAPG